MENYLVLSKQHIIGLIIGSWVVAIPSFILKWESGATFGFAFGISFVLGIFWITSRKNKKKIMESLYE